MDLTIPAAHVPTIEEHASVGVAVSDPDERSGDGDLDAELFAKLAPQGRAPVFARLDLTARELPQPSLVPPLRPLGDQHLVAVVAKDADGDRNGRIGGPALGGFAVSARPLGISCGTRR
jgi:hypothetical protein